jgi:hypothetical protein
MELKPDVNCWSVLTMPGADLTQHLRAGAVDDAEAAVLRRVNSVVVGVHYGAGVHRSGESLDFDLGTEDGTSAAALATAIGKRSLLLPISETPGTHLDGVSIEGNEVRGSVRVKDRELDGWLAAMYARLSGSGPREENVAQVGGAR